MTTQEKIARRTLSMLELAQEARNVSKAYKVMGYGRQQRAHPNRASIEIEQAILTYNLEYPTHGP